MYIQRETSSIHIQMIKNKTFPPLPVFGDFLNNPKFNQLEINMKL